jgi:hypothetical protein
MMALYSNSFKLNFLYMKAFDEGGISENLSNLWGMSINLNCLVWGIVKELQVGLQS